MIASCVTIIHHHWKSDTDTAHWLYLDFTSFTLTCVCMCAILSCVESCDPHHCRHRTVCHVDPSWCPYIATAPPCHLDFLTPGILICFHFYDFVILRMLYIHGIAQCVNPLRLAVFTPHNSFEIHPTINTLFLLITVNIHSLPLHPLMDIWIGDIMNKAVMNIHVYVFV